MWVIGQNELVVLGMLSKYSGVIRAYELVLMSMSLVLNKVYWIIKSSIVMNGYSFYWYKNHLGLTN